MDNDDRFTDDIFFYEHYENKDYFEGMPTHRKSNKRSKSSAIIFWITIILLALFPDSPGVAIFFLMFAISGKISGMFR